LVLFSLADKAITAGQFLEMANSNSKITGKPMDNVTEVTNAINVLAEEMLLEEEAMNLDKTDPEFAQLMADYRDGIFIFKIQEDEVWNKVKMDSADVYNYWSANKEEYSWPERVSFSEIFSTKDSLINKYNSMLNNGADFDSLAALYTERATKKKDRDHSNSKNRRDPPHIHCGTPFPWDDSNFCNLLTIGLTKKDRAITMIESQTMRKLIFWSNLAFRVHPMAAIPY